VDEETRERLRRFLSALAEWTGRFGEPIKGYQRQAHEGRAWWLLLQLTFAYRLLPSEALSRLAIRRTSWPMWHPGRMKAPHDLLSLPAEPRVTARS
jgi:hypothetical protein